MKKFFKNRLIKASAFFIASVPVAFVLFLALNSLFPFPVEKLKREPAVVVTDADGEPLRFFLPSDEKWRFPVTIEEVSPDLLRAIVASEDRWFHYYPGVNPLYVLRPRGRT